MYFLLSYQLSDITSIFYWYVAPHDLVNHYGISVKKNDHECVQCVVVLCPLSWPITGFLTRVTRRVLLVEQDLHTLRSRVHSVYLRRIRVTQSLVFCAIFCAQFLPFVLLWFIAYGIPFGILRPFFFTKRNSTNKEIKLKVHSLKQNM